ncbi:PAS domain S-box protein [Aliarcobacter butzleri]|uniref:PAS domain-containing protein n=1 Tax=Aliarcobacter butzleri TaxID=28197 RepID=UPI0012606DFC|nr:PAS domain-containing protein [Aliarcobacter butzleri]MCG3664526.1 PAS domain S-box protein [Aliarcobacter butzleri]MCT7537357.1 PAS domain S-box protein [Aliarcobacter butzleri]MCT7623836.1 PAS domain S-box protein [Aliarcobacter butzleri]MCT7649584.1 PAS domain S-box protein [Aliarcobacter butzleri]
MNKEIVLTKDVMIVSETDEKGNILYANADFCKIAGFSREELIGKPHNLVRHSDMPKDAFRDLWKTINNGNIWKGIVKNKTKQGEFYWVNATVYPSKTVDGRKRYISVRVKPTQEEIDIATKLYLNMK